MSQPAFEGWAKLELFGHRVLAGYVREVEMFGGKLCRIDTPPLEAVPADPANYQRELPAMPSVTQLYGEKAIYCLTPCSEEVARGIATRIRHQAVSRMEWQPRRLEAASAASEEVDEDDDDAYIAHYPDEEDPVDVAARRAGQAVRDQGDIDEAGPP